MSRGDLCSSLAQPRETFRLAIMQNAASIIVCSNHPSGDPTPSTVDIQTTERLREAGKILGISVLDHIIIGGSQHFSFKEHDLLNE